MTVFYDRWPPKNSFQFDFSTSSNKKKQEIHSNKYEFIISLTITRESDFFANVGDAEWVCVCVCVPRKRLFFFFRMRAGPT